MSNHPKPGARTPAGDAFTSFVVEVGGLGHFVTAAGEALAREGGQSLARWVVLEAIADEPATVSDIARRRGMARQPVQRIADALVDDGLAAYQANPHHRRAKLLALTPRGTSVLARIASKQKAWADAHGAAIGIDALARARELIAAIRPHISMPETTDLE
ncbi:MAG: MarR family winged helix-turn-helix transcriptional regulator [Candidatus Dormibacteria bacterium]